MRILILKMTLSDGQVVFLPSFVREDDVVTIHLPDWATKVNIIREEPTEAESGSFTALSSPMSSADKKWVHETFDGYETFEELLYDGMIPFVTSNFVYDSDYNRHFLVIQQFNFNQFRQDDFHGVCYQFAQWAKSVVTELYGCEVRCYIADVRLNRNYYKTHSYNYFIVEDSNGNRETYFVDFTGILSHYRRNEPYGCCVKKIGDMPFKDYSEKVLNDEVYRVY